MAEPHERWYGEDRDEGYDRKVRPPESRMPGAHTPEKFFAPGRLLPPSAQLTPGACSRSGLL
jgi:hypothetical protein